MISTKARKLFTKPKCIYPSLPYRFYTPMQYRKNIYFTDIQVPDYIAYTKRDLKEYEARVKDTL